MFKNYIVSIEGIKLSAYIKKLIFKMNVLFTYIIKHSDRF